YFTIVVVIPMSVFLKPVAYYPIQLCGALIVYPIIICCTKEHQADNLTNFTICMLISTVSATSFYNARIKNYKQLLALEELSEKDPVSGLYNQLKLEEKSEEIWKECKQKGQVISCLFCDIDEFKNLNDLYGNRFGEMCIRSVADAIREIPSKEKLYAFRYRNDEFLVILPGVNYADACRWTEQVRDAVSRKLWKKERQMAMNFGVYTACPFEDSSRMEQYILQADRLRYQAKQQGTNCVCSKDDTEDTE
ncbi:MAG: GGDEF domain-containing protein, partial [Lachnospiraceae bacterium]|nr:GGDEF domain-containing protein [Lachnospiraceae bacterium]